ncbi:MAG: hypothetical protein MK538_19280, partial [Planctomycetes bacterium]|nr:hypothetical protein [Planctomycetota bacterium]
TSRMKRSNLSVFPDQQPTSGRSPHNDSGRPPSRGEEDQAGKGASDSLDDSRLHKETNENLSGRLVPRTGETQDTNSLIGAPLKQN